jgi:hypothetical protein
MTYYKLQINVQLDKKSLIVYRNPAYQSIQPLGAKAPDA